MFNIGPVRELPVGTRQVLVQRRLPGLLISYLPQLVPRLFPIVEM
jgi:hypothetical protein